MSDHTDYNYFDVEDFSVDSFFRSLELQSRFASSDLEFSFPTDLENVPISSCLTSVGFLDSIAVKSSRVAAAEDSQQCSSGATESSVAAAAADDDDDDDDSASAVVSFFQSLQLRSCLFRGHDETIPESSRCSHEGTDVAGVFSHSHQVDVSNANSIGQRNDQALSSCEKHIDGNVCHGRQSSAYLPEKPSNFDYLSATWTCSSDNKDEGYHVIQQSSSTHVPQSETVASSQAESSELCHTPLCREEQPTQDDVANNGKRMRCRSKGGKMSCKVCGVELSSKYSFVRHLLTPMHCRRAEGYCLDSPRLAVASSNNKQDIIKLISRHKPVQCRVCRFYGDTSSQLLHHLTSMCHLSRVKSKRLQCVQCNFDGTCHEIVTHVKSESHASLVKQNSRPSVITACRRRQSRTEDKKWACSDCGAKFASASSLEIHVRRRHTRQRPFTCSICSKSYCDNSTLRLHYRTAQHRHKLYTSTV